MEFAGLISKNFNLKKLKKSEKNIFTVYSPKKATIERADTLTIDAELSIKLPENSRAFLATKFEGQNIVRIIRPDKKRLWVTLLNESYFNKYHIKKGDIIAYLVIEPENLKVHYEAKEKQPRQKKRCPENYLPKDWQKRWKAYFQKKKENISLSNGRVSQSL